MTTTPVNAHNGKLKSYVAGFILSVFFSVLAFALVLENLLTGNALVVALVILALVQACVQLVFFLHLSSSSRWNLAILLSTVSIILIVVVGSLWIMHHLNYNMTPNQMNQEIMHSENMMK